MPSALQSHAEKRVSKSGLRRIIKKLISLFGKPKQAMPFVPVKAIPSTSVLDAIR